MKKQKNIKNFVLKNNTGGALGVSNETDKIKLNHYLNIMKYISYILNTIYIILIISFIIIITKYIYEFKSNIIDLQKTQEICKDNIYENETARNKIYMLLSNKDTKTKLQKIVNGLTLSITIIYILIVFILSFVNNKYDTSDDFIIDDFIVDILRSSLFLLFIMIPSIIISTYYDKYILYVLLATLGVVYLYAYFKLSFNDKSIMDLFSIDFILITVFFVLIHIGLYLCNKILNNLYDNTDDYANKLAYLKEKVFTSTNLNEINLSNNRENPSASTNAADSDKTYGPFITLQENIIRRLLHSDNSGTILNLTDALNKYNTLRTNNEGVDTLIGFIKFLHNTEDYKVLQSIVCGPSLCNQGIGYHIKNLSDTNFTKLINDLQPVITASNSNSADLNTIKITFIDSVATYDVGLAKQLNNLDINDQIWKLLLNITSKDDIQQCDCKGNPLNLTNQREKIELLSILNYLATLSNGDITVTVKDKLSYMNYYLLCLYSLLAFIIFHVFYNVFDKKVVIGGYFALLIFIAIILGLSARLS